MALEGGKGQPRVVTIHHHIYSGQSYTRTERRGNTIYRHFYHRHYVSSGPTGEQAHGGSKVPGGGGGGGGGGGAVHHPDGRAQPGSPSGRQMSAWVVARQRLLRALGYPVRVDGVWGPRSQRYWERYVGRGGSTRSTSEAQEQRRQYLDLQRRTRQAQGRQLRVQAQRVARVQRSLDAVERNRTSLGVERRYDERADAVRWDRLEGRLQRQPTAAEKRSNQAALRRHDTEEMVAKQNLRTQLHLQRLGTIIGNDESRAAALNLRDLVLLTTNGLDVSRPRGARIVQRWLRAHGHKDLKVDGVFGPRTADALHDSWRQAVVRENRRQINLVVNAFYDSGLLESGGKRPSWWPFHGEIPNPRELRDLLQQGGFAASLIWSTLQRELRDPHVEYLMWRNRDIRKTANALFAQYGPGGDLSALERLGVREPENLLAMRVYNEQIRGIQANPLFDDIQEGYALSQLRARWKALASSYTIDQFQENLKDLEFAEEQAYLEEVKRRAEDLPWWADVLHEVARPGEWARTQLIAEIKWLLDDPAGYLRYSSTRLSNPDDWVMEQFGHNTDAFDYRLDREQEQYRQMAREEIADSPWLVRVGFEFIADPINLIPAGWFGIPARGGLKGLTVTGRGLTKIGETAGLRSAELGLGLVQVGRGIESLGLNALWLPQGARLAKAGILRFPGVGKVVSRSGALKLEAQKRMRATAEQATRLRFRPVTSKYPDLKYADDVKIKNSRTKALLEESEEAMKRQIHVALKGWVSKLNRDDVALFADHARSDYSVVGGMLRGYVYDLARIIETRRLADTFGKQRREAFLRSLDDEEVFKQWAGKRFSRGKSPNALDREKERIAGIHYQDEYNRVVRSLGVYLRGVADADLDDLLYQRVFAIAKKFEDHLFVHLQTMLEEMAEVGDNALGLWDESGRWAGRGGKLEQELRELVKDSFDESNLVEVENPLYGVILTAEKAENRIQSEIRRTQARYLGWVSRERSIHLQGYDENGNPLYGPDLPDATLPDNVDARLAEIEEEIRAQWFRVPRETYRFTLNRAEVAKLRDELNLPEIPIEVRIVTDEEYSAEFAGLYEFDKRITINIPESAVMAEGGDLALRWRKRLAETVAHEFRHAFQFDTLGMHEMRVRNKGPYWDRPIEVDARAFAEGVKHRLREMISFERVPAGSYVNLHETVRVSPLYARDRAASWLEGTPAEGLKVLATPSTFDDPLGQELQDVIWALGNSPKQGEHVGPIEPASGTGKYRPGYLKRDEPTLAFDQEALRLSVFRDEIAVSRAWDETMARLGVRNIALMQALAHSESFLGRRTYGAIKGGLDVWVTSTLPLRTFGWMLRNIVDNFVKIFIAGVRDPRAWFLGAKTPGAGLGGNAVKSVFEMGVRDIVESARVMDRLFGTRVAEGLEDLAEAFWLQSSAAIGKIFRAHGIPVADDVLEQMSFRPWEMPLRSGRDVRHLRRRIDRIIDNGDESDWLALSEEDVFQPGYKKPEGWVSRFRDKAWDLFASRPENYFRRALYRDTFYKEQKRLLARGVDEITADTEAMRLAWEKVEDVLFDYSKETVIEENVKFIFPFLQFWRKNSRFWIETAITKPWVPYDLARLEMEIQSSNEDLPEWARRYLRLEPVADLIAKVPGFDWLADYIEGLGFENLVTDPMNYLSAAPLWRAFKNENPNLPGETSGMPFIGPFLDALSDWGLTLNPFVRKPLESLGIATARSWQAVFPQIPLAAAFTEKYVNEELGYFIRNLEHVFTFFQGQPPAEAVAEDFNLYVQQEMANQAARGEPVSRSKAEEIVRGYIWLQTLIGFTTGVYARKLSHEDIYLYKLHESVWKGERRFSDLSDEEKRLVELWKRRKLPQAEFDRYVDAIPFIQAFYNQPDYEAMQRYKQKNPQIIPYVDPAWRGEQWTSNYVGQQALQIDTEAAIQMFKLAEGLKLDAETTQLATTLLVTPELREYWAQNDTAREIRDKQLRGLYHRRLWALNQQFFAIPEKDFEAKEGFLADHPELQEFWNLNNDVSDDYAAVLNAAFTDLRQRYFEYADAQDWDGANAYLQKFPFIFDRIKGDRFIRDRQTGRPDSDSLSQHAKDYLAAKRYLDYYFSLAPSARQGWLQSGAPGAQIVLDYFKKYGDSNRVSRFFGFDGRRGTGSFIDWDSLPFLKSHNAELSLRLRFWAKYFSLSPDKRLAFVRNHAEKYGIFIYGVLSMGYLAQQESEWLRMAFAAGMTDKAAHFLYVKPLLDFFFTLNRKQRKLFLLANPELQEYFDKYSKPELSGDPKLDALIERYFDLPPDSPARSAFLERHPEVQRFFDSRSTPAERALHRRLEQYFKITDPQQRKEFLLKHPEVQDYFDKKAQERDLEKIQLGVFDEADPRFQPLLAAARSDITESAKRMAESLLQARFRDQALARRTQRQPAES